MKTLLKLTGLCVMTLALATPAFAAQTLADRVTALKTNLATSQAALKKYEWIETTVVSLKGEEKSRKVNRCYYGADGNLEKVLVETTPAPDKKPGLRGKVIANKTEELTDYMQQAVGLVKSYVPPNPASIQAAKDAGKISVDMIQPGKTARINIHDYLLAGDTLSLVVDEATNHLVSLSVQTYLDNPSDVVTLDVQMATLPGGITYSSSTAVNAEAKKLQVAVGNEGYKKSGG